MSTTNTSGIKQPVRRRNRITNVCNRCKRRKIRCDKNKPCSNCQKMNYPCSYDGQWAPKPSGGVGSVAQPTNGVSAAADGTEMSSAASESDNSVSLALSKSDHTNNSWNASLVEKMVLVPKQSFQNLLPLLLQVPQHVDVTIAPIVLGCTGHMALNANVGVVRNLVHDPRFPGVLPAVSELMNTVEWDPHVVKLVKNDFVGVNPFQENDDSLVFAAPLVQSDPLSATIWDHQGVFTWKTLQLKDGWLSRMLKYTENDISGLQEDFDKNHSRVENSGMSVVHETNEEKTNGEVMAETPQDPHTTKPKDTTGESNLSLDYQRPATLSQVPRASRGPSTLGLMLFDGHVQVDLQMLEQMRRMLPNRRVVWTLMRRFFQVLYPFCPVVDEYEFRNAITKVIGPESYEETPISLNVVSRIDMIHLATLLVMVRFSFVLLFSNRKELNESILGSSDPVHQLLRYLFMHPVDVNAIEISHSCMLHFMLPHSILVPLFLLGMILQAYRARAPEGRMGVDGRDSHHYSSFLVSMAYSLGFHRDPSNYPGQLDPRKTMFIRKAWIFLCVCDVFQGYRFGNPTFTNTNFFDTKFPCLGDGNENLIDKELDRAVTKILNISDALIEGPMREIVELSLNVRRPASLPYLTSLLNVLEKCTLAGFGSLPDYLRPLETYNPAYSYGKLMKCLILLSLQIFYFTVLVHLLQYYEKQRNAPLYFYYVKKVHHLAVSEILAVAPTLVTKMDELFGDGVSIFMNPMLIDAIHRVAEVFIASMLRCNNYLYFCKKNPSHDLRMATDPDYHNHFLKVCELVVLLQRFCRLCMVLESFMGNRYFFAWRIFKRHQSFLLLMADPGFYDWCDVDPALSPTEGLHNFSCAQLDELVEILKKGLAFVERQVAENSEDITIESVWGKPQRSEVPVIMKEESREKPTPKPALSNTPAIPATLSTLGMSPGMEIEVGDVAKMLDLDLFALEGLNDFNDYEVDTLWQQMSTQKMQKNEQMERAAWMWPLDGVPRG